MDNLQFGLFIAELRRERGMTQKELAAMLNVTDKAVSKWETGKGFPDIKLMESLAEALGVTVVELIRCRRQEAEHLTVAEAGEVVSQAMDQSQKVTARRYLKLFRWLLIAICVFCAYTPILSLIQSVTLWVLSHEASFAPDLGIIGGADGPTAILTAPADHFYLNWLYPALQLLQIAVVIISIVLIFRVRRLEKKLK